MPDVYGMNKVELLKYLKEQSAKLESETKNLQSLELSLKNQTPDVVASGIRDVNKVIWPFTFSTGFMETSPTATFAEKNITVTQEAAFVVVAMVKQVFKKNAPNDYEWINVRESGSQIKDLYMTLSDPQSGRNFHREPMSVEHIGDSMFPTKLLSRPLILPNSSLNVKLYSQSSTETYFTNISLIGYRVRIEDAQDMLGLVTRDF